MPTPSTKHLTTLLNGLAQRARKRGDKPDLSPAIALVNDLGRLVVRGKAADIRTAQAAVAGVREQLEWEEAANTPYKALTGMNSHAYLAGALWAVNEFMTIRLDSMPSTPVHGRQTRKGRIKDRVFSALLSTDAATPSTLLESANSDDVTPRRDEISRILGELMADGLVESVGSTPGSDRRSRFFALTTDGRNVADERFATHGDTRSSS